MSTDIIQFQGLVKFRANFSYTTMTSTSYIYINCLFLLLSYAHKKYKPCPTCVHIDNTSRIAERSNELSNKIELN